MKEVFEYIEKNKDTYIDWLRELCQQPSVAAQNRGMEETADMVENFIENIGGKTKKVTTSGYPVIYGEFTSHSTKTLSFYNHYDVQPEDPVELWDYPPFGAEIHGEKIYGRGVADNKGNLIARIAAIDAYQKVKGDLPINLKFIIEGEEEIGSVHLGEFIENNQELIKADGNIWEFGYKDNDGRMNITCGVKGMCYVELVCRGANTDLHSSNAAIIENPAWRLTWALSTLKSQDEKINIKGFYDQVAKPTAAEVEQLEIMSYQEKETLNRLELDSFLLDLSGLPLKEKLVYQPTCTICGVVSGYTGEGAKTVLPNEARAKIDFRLVPDQDPDKIVDLLKQHLVEHGFNDIEVIKHSGVAAAKTNPEDPLVQSAAITAREVYQTEPNPVPMSPATGPMYDLCQKLGIPSVSVGVGHPDARNHAPNENIFLADFIDGIKHIAAIIDDFPKRLEK